MVASSQFSSLSPPEHVETLLEEGRTRESTRIVEPPAAPAEGARRVEEPLPAEDPADLAQAEDAWALALALKEADEIVEAFVTGHNKGGLLVRWHSLQGFVPASQLIGLAGLHVEEERRATLEARSGEQLQLKIIEAVRETNRLIFSERATEVTAKAREELLNELAEGQVRVGVVTNLADFGAFVDLGGVEGLVHISELSWRRLMHPGDVVRPGQKLNVLVMEVDVRRGRVALSRKKLRQDPWLGVEARYKPGQQVSGVVTNVADFGIFVLLEEGLEGLLHISEIENAGEENTTPFINKGARIDAEVIYVSERKRRLALSLVDGNA